MRKRILAGILAAVLSLSLAACGDTKQTASTEAETVQAQDGEKGLKELFEEGKKTDKKEETDQENKEQETTEESLEEEDDEKEKDTKKEKDQKDKKEKKQNMVSPEDAEISDDWEDMTFALDGTVFALPAPYGAFATQGWMIDWDDLDTDYYVLNPGGTKLTYLVNEDYNEDMSFMVEFTNNSEEVLEIRECEISMVHIEIVRGHKLLENVPEIEIAGGIKYGCSEDEIIDALGEADRYYEGTGDSFNILTYDNGSYENRMKLYVFDDKGFRSIDLSTNDKKPSINIDYDIDESLIAYEEPEYEEEEKPKRQNKKNLSDDWLDMEFSLDGEIHTMPEYFGFLAEEGWEVKDSGIGEGYVLNPGEMTFGTVDIYNKEYGKDLHFQVGFANTSDRVKEITECSIYSIEVDIKFIQNEPIDEVPELVVANDITWGSTAEDIIDAFGEADYEQNEDEYTFYSYNGEHGETLSFCVYDEYGVTQIEYTLQ